MDYDIDQLQADGAQESPPRFIGQEPKTQAGRAPVTEVGISLAAAIRAEVQHGLRPHVAEQFIRQVAESEAAAGDGTGIAVKVLDAQPPHPGPDLTGMGIVANVEPPRGVTLPCPQCGAIYGR